MVFFAFVAWAAPCILGRHQDHAWLLKFLRRSLQSLTRILPKSIIGVADESAKVKPTLVGELAVDFEVDLEEDSDLGDALYEYLGLEGDEGAAAEVRRSGDVLIGIVAIQAKGFRLLEDGYTQLLRKLDPQESLVVASTASEWVLILTGQLETLAGSDLTSLWNGSTCTRQPISG